MLNTPRPDKFNWQIIFLVTNIECHTRVSQIRLEFIFEVLLPHRLSTLYLYCYNYTQAIVLPATYHSLCLKDHRLVSELIKDHYNNYSNTISTPYHEIFYGAMKYCRKGTTHHNYITEQYQTHTGFVVVAMFTKLNEIVTGNRHKITMNFQVKISQSCFQTNIGFLVNHLIKKSAMVDSCYITKLLNCHHTSCDMQCTVPASLVV